MTPPQIVHGLAVGGLRMFGYGWSNRTTPPQIVHGLAFCFYGKARVTVQLTFDVLRSIFQSGNLK